MVDRLHTMKHEEVGEFLSGLDGSFACMLLKNSQLFVFRNALGPLFYDNTLNFSSVKFTFSIPVPAGVVWYVDFEKRKLVDTDIHFTTKNNHVDV